MKVNNTKMTADGSTLNIPMAGSFTTLPQQLLQTLAYAVECVFTGTTIAGSVEIQASLTYDPANHNAGTWVVVPGSVVALTGAGSGILNAGNAVPAYNWMRVVFADTGSSNDAVMAVTVNVKGF